MCQSPVSRVTSALVALTIPVSTLPSVRDGFESITQALHGIRGGTAVLRARVTGNERFPAAPLANRPQSCPKGVERLISATEPRYID
jgi:hypothetical protein